MLSLLAMLTLTFNIPLIRAPPEPVVIGWSHPLTGPFALTCAVHHLYYKMIIDDYNAEGGLNVGGAGLRPITYIEYDDEYDLVQSLDNYMTLIEVDNVDLLFAPWSTAFCVNALGLFESYQYPVVGLTVGSNTLSEYLRTDPDPYFWVTLGQPWEDAQEIGALFAYINATVAPEDEIGSAGILYRADEHGIEHAEAIRDNLTAIGIEVPVYTSYPVPPPAVWAPFVTALEAANVDAVIMCGYDECAAFVGACIAQDYNPKMLMLGPTMEIPFLVYDVFGFTPGEMAGIVYYDGFPATAYETPELQAWVAHHVEYTENKTGFGFKPFPASGVFYAGLECLFKAVEEQGLDREAIRDALETETFDTLVGTFKFRRGQSPIVENHGTLTQWQFGEMMEVIWPPENASTDHIIYPKYNWSSCGGVPDVNGDGKVDIQDLLTVALAFDSYPGHPRWDFRADINCDGVVNMTDLTLVYLAMGGSPQDIVVTNVTVSKSLVGQGYSVNIYVTVENQGTSTQDVTLDINFGSYKAKTGSISLNQGSSKTITLDIIPRAFLFEEVSREPGGIPTGNIGNLNLNGTGTSLKAMTGTITCGGLPLPGGIIELYYSNGTLIRRLELLIYPDPSNTVFTAGKYGEGLYVLGTTAGSLCFLDDKGEFGELTVGMTPVNDVQIEGPFITATTTNEVILLGRCSMDFKIPKGEYTISAYAEPVLGETDTTDNTYNDGTVLVTFPGDVNGDGKVRIDDVLAIALLFGSDYGEPEYDANVDINNDLKIRIDDVLIAATNFGQGP